MIPKALYQHNPTYVLHAINAFWEAKVPPRVRTAENFFIIQQTLELFNDRYFFRNGRFRFPGSEDLKHRLSIIKVGYSGLNAYKLFEAVVKHAHEEIDFDGLLSILITKKNQKVG